MYFVAYYSAGTTVNCKPVKQQAYYAASILPTNNNQN